jgi:hypothetical protein
MSSHIDEVKDANEKREWDEYRGEWRVHKMYWHIHQGDDLSRARPIELDFSRSFDEYPDEEELQVVEELQECNLERAARYPREASVKQNCALKVDLSTVPEEYFERKSRRGENGDKIRWWELRYKLVLTISSGPMQFSMKCRGKEYGSVKAEY